MDILLNFIQLIGLTAIAGTQEIDIRFMIGFVAVGLLGVLFKKKLSDRSIAFGILISIMICGWGITKLHYTPIIASTYGIIPVHILLWFSTDAVRIRRWLMVIAFFEITLAGALSPDFYLAFLILVYSILSQHYLMRYAAGISRFNTIPKAASKFIHLTGLFSIVCALILFPFLPRTHRSSDEEWLSSRLGYTETVDLNRTTRINEGPTRTALRVFISNTDYPLLGKYIRGRALDHFTGTEWFPSSKRKMFNAYRQSTPENATLISIIRDPIESPSLPVPYGTGKVTLEALSDDQILQKTTSDEWIIPYSEKRRIRYEVYLGLNYPSDPPIAPHLRIAPNSVSERFKKWVEQAIPQSISTQEKVNRISTHFRKEGYTVSLEPLQSYQSFSLLDRFFFIEKAGNCELYSTVTAMALRHSGVPARLVSGFKINRPLVGGFINVLVQDAHAWVEYWNAERKQWQIYDPTPQITSTYGLLDEWIDRIEWTKSLWYQYIISYEDSDITNWARKSERKSKQNRIVDENMNSSNITDSPYFTAGVLLILIGFIVSSIAGFPKLRRTIENSRREKRIRLLNSELDRFESLFTKLKQTHPTDQHLNELLAHWQGSYEYYRFGSKNYQLEQAITELKVLRLGIERISKPFTNEIQE